MVDDKRTLGPFATSAVSSMAGGGGVKRMQAEAPDRNRGTTAGLARAVRNVPLRPPPGSGARGRSTIQISR